MTLSILGRPGADPSPDPGPGLIEQLSVFVRGIRIDAGIGVHDHEIGRLQRLVIDVTLEVTPAPVERLADTVNYEAVAAAARSVAAAGHIGLVETFAERLAHACLAEPRVLSVRVRVEKPGCLDGADAAGCEGVYRR